MVVKKLWQRIALAIGGLVVLEAGARLVAPGLSVEVLANYLRNGGGSWLLSLYNQLGGGALVRGGVLALGILPFLSAKIMVRLARFVSPAMEKLSGTAEGRASLARWTRILTVGLAGIQSLGFARFVQKIPGAVAHPGIGFIVQTMLVLTTGSVVAMAIGEQISRAVDDDDDDEPIVPPAKAPPLELGEGAPEIVNVHTGERVKVE